MAIASGSSRGLAYGIQTARGTPATTTTLVNTAKNGQAFQNKINMLEPSSMREDGQPNMGLQGTHSTTGSMPFNFSYDGYNDFVAAALRQAPSSWPATAPFKLGVGTTVTYFTFEDRFTDIGQYLVYSDSVLNMFKLTATQGSSGAYVTASADFIGTVRTISGTQIAVPTSASTTTPFTGCGGVVSVGGTAIATVTSFNFTIDNGMKDIYVLGQCSAYDVVKGPIKVSGTLTVYFQDSTYISDVDNQTSLDIKLTLTSGANTYTFEFPFAKLSSDSISGGTESLTLSLPFTAAYDPTTATTVTASHS